MNNKLSYTITEGAPLDPVAWNDLCRERGNLVQSTYFDKVQEFYKQIPIYVEVKDGDAFVAGVKFYFWQSTKNFITKMLSAQLTQFGELIFKKDAVFEEFKNTLFIALNAIIRQKKTVSYRLTSFYGNADLMLILKIRPAEQKKFTVGYFDLTKNENDLFNNLDKKQRTAIRKAERMGVCFFCNEIDLSKFFSLFSDTYNTNPHKEPNKEFLKHIFLTLKKSNSAEFCIAKHNNEIHSGTILYNFGKVSYGAFGANKRSKLGAGNFLRWEIAKELKHKGYEKYYLGQIAIEDHKENPRFMSGISSFKRRFGLNEIPGISSKYIIKPEFFFLWNLALNIIGYKRK